MGSLEGLAVDGLNTAAFFLGTCFVAYVVLLVVPTIRRRPEPSGDGHAYEWHFVIPCLNEAAVVGETVRRLVAQFPGADVWCVDDDSDDDTPAVLAHLAAQFDQVHVVTRRPPEARQGKGPALNAAWTAIREALPPGSDPARTIVGVVDADGYLDADCLDVISGPTHLGDPSVGAVQVQVRVIDRSAPDAPRPGRLRRLLIRLQDLEFTCVIAAQQALRRHLGVAGMGGNGQFTRLSVLDEIAEGDGRPWHDSLIEDFELGLHVLFAGYRTQYCHDTWVEQEGLFSFRRLVRQRSRWGQGNMECWRYFHRVMRCRHISTPAALEITYFLALPWIQLVGSIIYVVLTSLAVYVIFFASGGISAWFGAGAWGLIPLLLLFGIGPLAIWGPFYRRNSEPSMSRLTALTLGVANAPYTMAVNTSATWWAFSRVVRSRHDWKKTQRVATRPVTPPAPAPTGAAVLPVAPAVPIAAAPSHLVVGTFARTHQRRIEYRRTTAVGRFRPRHGATPTVPTERTQSNVEVP